HLLWGGKKADEQKPPTTFHAWDVAAGKEVRRWQSAEFVERAGLAPDGRLLASVGSSVRLWDVQTGKERHALKTPQACDWVAFSANGKTLAAVSRDHLCWWDVASGKELGTAEFPSAKTVEVLLTFSPMGNLLVGNHAGFDLWDLARKKTT